MLSLKPDLLFWLLSQHPASHADHWVGASGRMDGLARKWCNIISTTNALKSVSALRLSQKCRSVIYLVGRGHSPPYRYPTSEVGDFNVSLTTIKMLKGLE